MLHKINIIIPPMLVMKLRLHSKQLLAILCVIIADNAHKTGHVGTKKLTIFSNFKLTTFLLINCGHQSAILCKLQYNSQNTYNTEKQHVTVCDGVFYAHVPCFCRLIHTITTHHKIPNF